MKRLAWFLGPGLLLLPASGWADSPPPLSPQAQAVLQTHCAMCHGGGKAVKGGFGFVLDRDQLVSRLLVVPGKAEQSDLFLRIQQGEMPPPGRKERPGQAELQVLKRWIDAGAPAFDRPLQTAKVLPEGEVPGVIRTDLEQLDPRRRRFTRYLTLTHLAHAGRPEKDLQTTREAAGKLLNSLSWHPRIAVPDSLADRTILRIDLRAYKWTAALWEKLAAAYPYRTAYQNDATRAIASHTGSEVAAVRADWFVANASRPPLYHDLLQLPSTDRGLERLLQVDVPGNIQDDNVMRAGFNDSGVSKNNRLIERHDAAHGALWRSYDFEKNTGRQNLFDHPMGPNAGAVSFQPAGGEIIFHLPNGLHGYMLVDAQGRRIDKAPGEIVADPRRPDQRVETGISCMSCHARGLLPKADQLRAHVEKNAAVFDKSVINGVRATHPRKAAFQARIEEDNVRYLRALEKFGVRDPDQEPVNLVTQRFEATLDGRTVAAEVGVTFEELRALLQRNSGLARLLGGALVPGGTVQREVFQEHFAALAKSLADNQTVAAAAKQRETAPFKGHTGTVNCVTFSADGKLAASGSDDRTVRVWDIGRNGSPSFGMEVACLKGSTEVYAVTFSPDGKFLVSGGGDRVLRIWDIHTGKQVRALEGHTDAIRSIAVSPDGTMVASAGDDRSVRVWNVSRGVETITLAGHAAAVTSIVWSPDGQRMLTGSFDGTVRLWDPAQGREVSRLEGHAGPVLSVALSPDGRTALSGGNDKTVRLWTLPAGNELCCFKGHANAVIQVAFSADGRVVYSSSSQYRNVDRTWRRWELERRTEIGSVSAGGEISFGCAAFSPDGQRILVGGPGGFLHFWSWSQ